MKRENPSIEICPGITRRTVANGKTMYQMIATLAALAVLLQPADHQLKKSACNDAKHDRLEERLVLLIERAVDEHASAGGRWHSDLAVSNH